MDRRIVQHARSGFVDRIRMGRAASMDGTLRFVSREMAFRTKDPKQIDRAVGASFTPAFHLAVANQAIQSRSGPAIIGSFDQP